MSVELKDGEKEDRMVYHVGQCLTIFKTFFDELKNDLHALKDDIGTAKRVWQDCATQYEVGDSMSLFPPPSPPGRKRRCSPACKQVHSDGTITYVELDTTECKAATYELKEEKVDDPRAECKASDNYLLTDGNEYNYSLPYLSEDDVAWWTGRVGNKGPVWIGSDESRPYAKQSLMKGMHSGCDALNKCMQALGQCEEPFDCCENMDDLAPHQPRKYTRCKSEHERFQRGEKGTRDEPAIPWPPYVCDYRVKPNFGVIGYDKSLASFHGVSVHTCARKCFDSNECQSFDFRDETVDHFAANCILRPLTAARVLNFAFGQSGAGWSYFETKARGDLTDGSLTDGSGDFDASDASKSDVFNTCGKAVGRALPPKRGAAVVFFKPNTWLEVGTPFHGTPADVDKYNTEVYESIIKINGSDTISKQPPETVLEVTGDGKTLRNGGLPPAMRANCSDYPACLKELDQKWVGPLSGPSDQWLRDGYGMNASSGMPDILLFGGVYDDGCTSQETWMFNAQANQWGWRDALGAFHQGPMPDPLCENDALLQPKNNLPAMRNKLLIARISPWQRYQYRRLGIAKYSEVVDKLPSTPKLCPPTARVGASGLRWGRRFVMFGGAQWRRSLRSAIDPRFNLNEQENADTVEAFNSHDLYDIMMTDVLAHEDGVGQNDASEFIPARSHTRRAQTMFNDVWVLEQRLAGGLLTSTNWYWSLLSSDGAMLLPMGRYDAATMIVEERSTMFVFGGRSFNRSYNDLWSFDLVTRAWRELTPEKGDRPMPRHGAAIASLKNAGGHMDGTLIMSFGREISPWRGPEISITDVCKNISVSETWTVRGSDSSGLFRTVRWDKQPDWHGDAEVCAICEKSPRGMATSKTRTGVEEDLDLEGVTHKHGRRGQLRDQASLPKTATLRTSERAHPDGVSSGPKSSCTKLRESCKCPAGWYPPAEDVEEVSDRSKVIVRSTTSGVVASFSNPRHSETFFREIWTFSAVNGWKNLDYEGLCGCNKLVWDTSSNMMKKDCTHGEWEWRCPQGRWGHAMVIPSLRSYDRTQDGQTATPKTEEPTYATFVGGWGEGGRAVRTVLKLYFENSLSNSNTPCETNCFEEAAVEKDSQLAAPCEECGPEDACYADHMRGPRVSPSWACGTATDKEEIDFDTSRCPSAHLPLVCLKSGNSVASEAKRNISSAHFQAWAPGGYPLKRLDENTLLYPPRSARPAGQENWENMTGITVWGDDLPLNRSHPNSDSFTPEASLDNPCRQTSEDADFEDLGAVNAAEQWDENGVAKLVVYSCSRLSGAISLDISALGLNGFTPRRGKGYRWENFFKRDGVWTTDRPPNTVVENAAGVGGYGGSCTCPDGTVYQVGDNQDYCGSLACVGGISGTCNSFSGAWSNRRVTCNPGTHVSNRPSPVYVERARAWTTEPTREYWRSPTISGGLNDKDLSIPIFPEETHKTAANKTNPNATHRHPAGDLFKWEDPEPGANLEAKLQGWDKDSWIGGPTVKNNYPWSNPGTMSLLAQLSQSHEMPRAHTDYLIEHAMDDDEFTVLHRMPTSYIVSGTGSPEVDGTYTRRVFRSRKYMNINNDFRLGSEVVVRRDEEVVDVDPVPQHGKLSFLYEREKTSVTSQKTVVLIRQTSPGNLWLILKNETIGCPPSAGDGLPMVLPWCILYTAEPAAQDAAQKWDQPGVWFKVGPSKQSMGGLQAVPTNFASHILPQSCPRGNEGGMLPVCYQVSLGWCKEQCETYSSNTTQPCCDKDSPKDATDFFNRPCRNPVPTDVGKLRCQACTGFAYNRIERSCVLTHSDWYQEEFYPEEELSDIQHSTFYVREAVLGHVAGTDGQTVRCPYLSSGYDLMDQKDVLPYQSHTDTRDDKTSESAAMARSPISDLEMCTGTDRLWSGSGFNGKPVNLQKAGYVPFQP